MGEVDGSGDAGHQLGGEADHLEEFQFGWNDFRLDSKPEPGQENKI